METLMIYDRPLEYAWENCRVHVMMGETGCLVVPLTNVVETQGRYSLVALNEHNLRKTIYAALEVQTFSPSLADTYYLWHNGRRYITIPVADAVTADKVFWLWEQAYRTNQPIIATTNYMLERL